MNEKILKSIIDVVTIPIAPKEVELSLIRIIIAHSPKESNDNLIKELITKNRLELVGCLYDGLAYGNWPWVKV